MATVLPALRDVKLDDKYELESGRVYLTGAQAFVRLLILQRQRDKLAGLNTGGFVSGYRGSPLGALDQSLWKAQQVPRPRERRVPARPERGPRGHVDLGHAAGQPAPRRQGRWRVRHVVRQGPGRGPLRRRVQARELRGHVEARRRAGARRRRPRGQVLDAAASIRSPVLRRDDAGAVSVVGAGDPRPRPARLGDVALLRMLGRLQVRRRYGRVELVGVDRSRAHADHRARRLSVACRTACRSAGPMRSSPPRRACRTTRSTRRCTTAASTSSTASSSIRRARASASRRPARATRTCARRSTTSASPTRTPPRSACASTRSRCRGRSSRKACATSRKASRRSSSSRKSARSSSTS